MIMIMIMMIIMILVAHTGCCGVCKTGARDDVA